MGGSREGERPISASNSIDSAGRVTNKTMFSPLNFRLKSLLESNSLEKAESVSRTILLMHRMDLPDDDEAVLVSKMNLAGIYQMRSKFAEAEELQEETLAGMKEKLGVNHQLTIQCMMNQAETFASRGRTEAAVSLLERTLQILPFDASQALAVKSSLATKLASLGKLEDAKVMFSDVMETRQKNLGPMHPDTLCTRANLAGVYFHLGAWKHVENIATSVLPALEEKLSVSHPYVMACRRHLALSLQNQGQYEKAKELHLENMDLHNQIHGREHIETLNCMADIASWCKDTGLYEEAEELQDSAINSLEGTVGEDHPDTLYFKVDLIGIYTGQGRYEEAVNLGKLLVEQTEHVLGKQHTTTLSCLQNLALAYRYQDRFQEAEHLERQVLKGMAKLDKNHHDALTARANLALTCFELEKHDEAKELFANGEGMLHNEDPAALTRLHNLSFVLSKRGFHHEAIAIADHVLQVRMRKFGNDKPETLVAKGSLAMAYRGEGNHAKALELLQESTSTSMASLGPKHRTTLINLFNLALVLFERGEIDLAEDGGASIIEDLEHEFGPTHDTCVQCKNLLSRIRQMREESEI